MYYIFTDGSSSRKRGTIGSAFALYNKEKKLICTENIGFKDPEGRNGISELIAIYLALSYLDNFSFKYENTEIIIYSDSQYCVNELNTWFISHLQNDFYNKKNKEIIIYILYLLYKLRKKSKIKLIWIKGHQKEDTFESNSNNYVDKEANLAHEESFHLYELKDFIEDLKKEITINDIYKFVKEKYLYGTTKEDK